MDSFLVTLEQAAKGTFWEHLGCRLVKAEGGIAIVEIDVQKHHLNGLGILHGGVHASLLDNTMGLAAMSLVQSPQVVTTTLQVHFTAPLEEGRITAEAQVVHRTARSITAQGRIVDGEGRLGAFASASFRILGSPNSQQGGGVP
jgi:uncharacterized protein (TIGR00369 family)